MVGLAISINSSAASPSLMLFRCLSPSEIPPRIPPRLAELCEQPEYKFLDVKRIRWSYDAETSVIIKVSYGRLRETTRLQHMKSPSRLGSAAARKTFIRE
jgi:hypothetical protein